MSKDPDRVSRAEIAEFAGVRRPNVANWARRYGNFPAPVEPDADPQEFSVAEIAGWLDSRRIRVTDLAPGERVGTSYGERFRHAHRAATARLAPADGSPPTEGSPPVESLVSALVRATPRDWEEPRRRAYLLDLVVNHDPGAAADRKASGAQAVLDSARLDRTDVADLFDALYDEFHAADGPRSAVPITPRSITDLVGRLADGRARSVYDPHCRTGELLAGVIRRHAMRTDRVGGQSEGKQVADALRRLRLRKADARVGATYPLAEPVAAYDLVVTNPPFNANPTTYFDGFRWPFGSPPTYNANYCWLQYAYASLAHDSLTRAMVVMPSTAAVSTHPSDREARARMLRAGVVECVISLPRGMFTATGAVPMLWILRRPSPQPGPVLFIDATELARRIDGRRQMPAEERANIAETYWAWRNGKKPGKVAHRPVGVDAITAADGSLNPQWHITATTSRTKPTPVEASRDLLDLQRRAVEVDRRVARLLGEAPWNR